jgi:AmmeMemoRadiSam system protein B
LLVRRPAVAGTFYPSDERSLRVTLRRCFDDAVPPPLSAPLPAALVVPHAGYVYSGPVAASAYLRLVPGRRTVRRVVLLGPSHRVPFRGLALSSADAWATPLGEVTVDDATSVALSPFPFVRVLDVAHADEHSLEVQLPFLQTVLEEFSVIPVVVGDASVDDVAAVIDALWSGPDTLVVVSTDLSHYHRYADAIRIDARTARAIAELRSDHIAAEAACGAVPLQGLLRTAADRHLAIEQLDLRNSGDTGGDRERVVGYAAFALS